MSYQRDFTIGLRETRAFYLLLDLSAWWKGILGFGAAGALAAILYTNSYALSNGLRVAVILLGALLAAVLAALWRTVATCVRVNGQVRRAGKTSYVQQVAIDGFGVHVTVGKDKAKVSFDKLFRVWETRGAFYIFLAENQAWILPKKQMADAAVESGQLRRIFQTVVPSRQLRLRRGA